MPSVNIPNVGVVNFPDTMSHEDIANAITNDIMPGIKSPTPSDVSATSTAIHGAERGVLPLAGALAGGEYGAAVGTALLPGLGTLGGGIIGGLVGGLGASTIVSAAQEKFLKANPKIAETLGQDEATREAEEKAHPNVAFASELAPSILAFRPSGALLKGTEGLTEKAAELVKAQKTAAIANATINSGIMAGMEAGQEYINEGKIDPTKVAIAAGVGATGQKETALGRSITKLGQIPMTESMRASVEALRRPEGEVIPETKETPATETPIAETPAPIPGALDATHFDETEFPTAKTPEQKIETEINRAAEGKNPEPTPEEIQAAVPKVDEAKKAAEDLQAQQEAAINVPKAETTIKPTDIVTEEGVKLNEPTDTTLITKKDVETLGKESKKALEQNLAEKEAAQEIPKAPKAVPTKGIQAALKESGGINTEHLEDLTGEKTVNKSGATVGLFTKEGKGLDDAVDVAVDKGYLSADVKNEIDGGVQALRDLIQDEIHGKKAVPLEAQGNAELEAYLAREEQKRAMEEAPKETAEEIPATEEEANKRLAEAAAEEQGKVYFSKGAIEGGVNKEHFYDRILREFGPSVRGLFKRGLVEVYNTLEEVPEHIRKHFDDNTRALSVVENGKRKAIVVANRIHAGEVREVILHEVGEHYGLRGMLGEDVYKQILNTVENLKTKDMLVKAAYDETFNTPYYRDLYKTNKDEFLSEVIAKLGEKAPNHGLIKRIVQAVKTFLIKKGFIKDVTGAEIQDLVMHSLRTAMDKDLPQFNNKGEPLRSTKDVGYHAGDLGYGFDTVLGKMSGRSTGHFGTGVYFVGHPEKLGSFRADRPVHAIDFSKYNLAKPATREDAFKLHDGLKDVNEAVDAVTAGVTEWKGHWGEIHTLDKLIQDAATKVSDSLGLNKYLTIKNIIKDEVNKAASKYEEVAHTSKYEPTAATELMKKLGYEGVDVRNLPDLDNTAYGSVIYTDKVAPEVMRSQRPENPAEAQRVKEKLEAMGAPKTTPHGSQTLGERYQDTANAMKEGFEAFKGGSFKQNLQKVGKAGSKLGTKIRIALMDYSAGLQEADARRYGRSVTKANGEAISTVAVTDAIHSNHIMAQVMLKGKLIFNKLTKNYQAVESAHSMANVYKAEAALYKKLGKDTGATLINTYGNALRARSIQNEFEIRHGRLLELKEGIQDAESLAKNNPDALAAKLHELDVLTPENYARMKQNPDTLAKRLMKLYDNARADAEKDFESIIKAYTSIPKEFCVLDSKGERHVQKVLTRGGKEVAEVPLINDDHIDTAIHEENANPELREIMDNFTAVNQNMLDNMYHAGLLNEGRYHQLKSIKDYVPWQRVDDETEPIHYTAPGGTSLSGAKTEKKFKKGFTDKDVGNIISNMESHINTMGTNSIRNYAANEVVKDYGTRDANGKLKLFPREEVTKDGAVRTNIVVDGRRVIIEVKDPLVAESMLGVHQIDVPMMKGLGAVQQLFRRSITANPFFQIYQVFKDAPTAAAVTGLKNPFKVYAKIFGSFAKALRTDDEIVNILKSHGIGGFKLAGRTAEKEFNLQMGVQQHKFTSRILSYLDHIGDASDYAQRRVIYEETLKQTGSHTQALYNANAIIDFMKRGNSKAAQFEVRTVSFMNAFGQQMDVLLQGMAGGGIKGMSRSEARRRFWMATGGFASATLAYCMLKGNDPDYHELDDETKNRNFVFGKFKIPCSTSYSFLYKSVIENTYNYITSQATQTPMDATHLRQILFRGFMEAGAGPNMIPTALRPGIEIAFNHDTFTGGNVVPQSLAKLDPFMQYTNTTSELGKTMSHLSAGALNPIQMDHLMKGILGTAGTSMMWLSDMFTANKPAKTWAQNPFVGSFALQPVGHGPEALFYDLKERTDAKYDTFMKLAQRQHGEDAKKYIQENKGLIAAHEYTTQVAPRLQEITREIQRMSDVPATSVNAQKKRDLITEYQKIENQILKTVPKMRKELAGL